MEELDAALELDLSAGQETFGSFGESNGFGLDSLASELANAQDEDGSSEEDLSLPGTPRRVKASKSSAMTINGVDEDHELEAAFSEASLSLEASLAPANLFLDRLRTAVESSAKLEVLSSSLLRSVTTLVKQREAQVREWQALSKALALLTPLQASNIDHLEGDYGNENAAPGLDSLTEEEPTTPSSTTFSPETSPTMDKRSARGVDFVSRSTISQLKGLHASTASLLSSLGGINEATQEQRAASAEASRRLNALRDKLATWRTELEELEGDKQALADYASQDRSASEIATGALDAVRIQLEEAEHRAVQLLTFAS